MPQYVSRYNNAAGLIPVSPTSDPVTKTDWGNLIMLPGVYQYNSLKYDLSTEGLYGILNIGVDGGWRIIYQSDIYALMAAFAWLCTYGRMDEGLTNAQLTTRAKTIKLSLRCEKVIDWVLYLLASQGVSARKCRLLTAETPNGWDEGHVAIEVLNGGAWKFWDIPNNFYPEDGSVHLNLKDYILDTSISKIFIADGERDLLGAGSYQLHTNIIYDMFLRTENDLDNWVDRIYQIPGIVHTDGKTYFYMPSGTESRQTWLLSLDPNYRVVSYATWESMFY